MYKQCLIADVDLSCIARNHLSCHLWPGIDKPLLQEWRLQPLCPQVPQYQVLNLLYVSLCFIGNISSAKSISSRTS